MTSLRVASSFPRLCLALVSGVLLQTTHAIDLTIEKELSFDGKQLRWPATLADLEKILGPADRVTDLANQIHTWDKQGVTAYTKAKEGGNVEEICIQFAKEPFPFSPRESWSGKLVAFGLEVGPKTSNESFEKAAFKRKTLREAYNYEKTANGIEISVDTVSNKIGWTRLSITSAD